MSRSFLFLINPISGGKNKDKLKSLILKKFPGCRISDTDKSGQYNEVRSEILKEKITDVIICGGDGSVNQAVNALASVKVNFGIIPMGSGNGLAYAAGIPGSPAKALNLILNGKIISVDAFKINNHFSCMLSGLGFDADVAHTFARQKTRGLKTYIAITIKTFLSAKSYPFKLTIGNKSLDVTALFISIANSNQFGNNFKIAPKASLSDGLLDIVVVRKMNKIKSMAKMSAQLLMGRLTEFGNDDFYNGIHYFQTDNLLIENKAGASLHIDGEPVKTEKFIDVRIIKGAFNLISGDK